MRGIAITVISFLWVFIDLHFAQTTASGRLFSPLVSELYVRTAYDLSAQGKADAAVCFLRAASALERSDASLAEPILRIGSQAAADTTVAEWMQSVLAAYLTRQPNLDVALTAIGSMLEPIQSRSEREIFLERFARRYVSAQPIFGSEILTQMGLLAAEKTDFQTASEMFKRAAELNPYNLLAREKYFELAGVLNQAIPPEATWVNLRLLLDIQPYHLSAVMRYADGLMQMEMYAEAAKMYEYAEQLFRFLQPGQPLPRSIYLPRLLCLYRAPNALSRCLELADQLRRQACFDLMAEAIAGLAAQAAQQKQLAEQIFNQAVSKARQLTGEQTSQPNILPEEMAWFYAFALREPEQALAWADKAYRQAPQRPMVKPIFVYALILNGQMDLAAQLLESTLADPLSLISRALIVQTERPGDAVALLRQAIAAQPAGLEAELARELLKQLGSEYLQPLAVQEAVKALETLFGGRIVPTFLSPTDRISCKLNLSSSELLFGTDFDAKLIVQNKGTTPLVIQPDAFWDGRITVSATIRGDIQQDISRLLEMRIRPPRPINPNEDLIIPLDIYGKSLRKWLLSYPQANMEIEITASLDSLGGSTGTSESLSESIRLVSATLKRRAVAVSRDFLMQRLDTLAKGQEGQKLLTIRLFAALLAEQIENQKEPLAYKPVSLDRRLLSDAVRRALADDSWVVRVYTIEALSVLGLEGDYPLLQSLSENLNHSQWPVRLMALYALHRLSGPSFSPVLGWVSQQDPNEFCKNLAKALLTDSN